MHDLDRALQEMESDETFESDSEFDQEFEGYDGEASADSEAVFDEMEQMEQAAALLEVQDEGELDHFLGGLINKVKRKIGKALPPGVQQALGGALKKVAQTALPKVGAVLGNVAIPGLGGVLGSGLMSNASKLFGLELEGMSYEDQEFEVAKRVVGLTAEATKAATTQTGTGAPPVQVAKDAVVQAAQTHAPGLVGSTSSVTGVTGGQGAGNYRGRSGRWYRRGRRIILVGA